MPHFQTGTVLSILESRDGFQRALVDLRGVERRAVCFSQITGPIEEGNRVVVNTTGIDLELGSGGEDFVLWNLDAQDSNSKSGGHILKLRYTPLQMDTLVAEAPESPYYDKLKGADSIGGMPVITCGLHSQLAPAALMARRAQPKARIGYVMTDGAALPIALSDTVAELRSLGVIDVTVTCGHSFGGDLESINVYSALAAARIAAECDLVIVSLGPGVVGTGSLLGHTELEQALTLSAASFLGGLPVASIRVSFAESRERHRVVSHHSLTSLRVAPPSRVALPLLPKNQFDQVVERLSKSGVLDRHEVVAVDVASTLEALRELDHPPTTMGRSIDEDPEFFLAAGAAGLVGAQLVEGVQ